MNKTIRIKMQDDSIWEMPISCVISYCANLFQLQFDSYSVAFDYYESLFTNDGSKELIIHCIKDYMNWDDVKDYITLVQENKNFSKMFENSEFSVI